MRIGSLCSGYGGLEMAVRSVLGGEVAWVADNDPGAAKILAHRMPEVPNLGDITAIDWNAVEPVDVLTAGFPCQDVSCAGARKGLRAGNRTGVWSYVAQAIGALRPPLVLLENVRGLLSAGADSNMERCPWCMGEAGDEHALRASGAVLGDLADLGFDAEWTVVSASDAGAPHRRERVFIVAWPAADADGGELQRWRVRGVLAGPERAAEGARDQREWDGDAADSRGAVAEDADRTAGGERRLAVAGEAEGGRPRANAGGPGGARALANACGAGLEVRGIQHHGPERPAAERGSRALPPADADGTHTGPHARGSGEAAPARASDGQEWRGEPGSSLRSGAPADTASHGRDEGRSESARVIRGSDVAVSGHGPATDPERGMRDRRSDESVRGSQGRVAAVGDSPAGIEWGSYGAAIHRWEHATGRRAPAPTEPGRTGQRLSPRFVEWMMGLPEGWVTDIPGLSRNAQLKALGNGVVPQQAAMALRMLLGRTEAQEAA